MTASEQLIEDVIFWEKHTEIYDSLEKTLRDKYVVKSKDENPREKDGILSVIRFFIGAQMDNVDNYRTLKNDIENHFYIKYK